MLADLIEGTDASFPSVVAQSTITQKCLCFNMTTLSLETSRKIHDLIGDYETCEWHEVADDRDPHRPHERIPTPNFSELIRILPKIGEGKDWGNIYNSAYLLVDKYMDAVDEKEGMKAVERRLLSFL